MSKIINEIENFYKSNDSIAQKIVSYIRTLAQDKTRRINDKNSPTLGIGFNQKCFDALLIQNLETQIFENFHQNTDFLKNFPNTSFKRAIIFHYAEFCPSCDALLSEIFRILESENELIIIAFNKTFSKFSQNFIDHIRYSVYDITDSLATNSFGIKQISSINQNIFKFLPSPISYTLSKYTDFAVNLFPIISDIVIIQAQKQELSPEIETVLNPSYDAV